MSAPAPRRTASARIRRFILPYWGTRQLNSLTGEEIAIWEHKLPATEEVSRSTAKDARSLLHTILGDAAAAKPPLIPFNPAVRPRNRGRRSRAHARPKPAAGVGDTAGGAARGRAGRAASGPG